ncbi:AlpA family phage regulatory protein [Sphingomonadaceae bacterium OTU29LAMAA1]|nr:AlpA family phage regulatory protein [Sphingomonadaceae bacterium OTU29LAMAA1]
MVAAGTFPDRVRLGPARVGWRTSAIAEWINSRPLASTVSASGMQGRSA